MEPLQPGEEAEYRRWIRIRSRLQAHLGQHSGLTAPLAAYVLDHAGRLDLWAVKVLREEYGGSSEPSAEQLMPLLIDAECDESARPPGIAEGSALPEEDTETCGSGGKHRERLAKLARYSDLFPDGYLDEVREGWPE